MIGQRGLFLFSLLVLGGAIAYVMTSQHSESGTIQLQAPEWLSKSASPSPALDAVPASSAPSTRTSIDVASESGLPEMLPPSVLTQAITQSKQEVQFEMRVLVNAGVAQDIAASILEAAESHYKMYKVVRHVADQPDKPNTLRKKMDYFFAVWPDLGNLINTKRVAMQVAPTQSDIVLAPGGAISYFVHESDRTVTAILQTRSWHINLTFNSDSGPKEMFDAIFLK